MKCDPDKFDSRTRSYSTDTDRMYNDSGIAIDVLASQRTPSISTASAELAHDSDKTPPLVRAHAVPCR